MAGIHVTIRNSVLASFRALPGNTVRAKLKAAEIDLGLDL